ncbi:hypothetical protein [Enterococcus sp. AZ128]|uniref:hypothetical protein n=1 Tax=Enterococcus sp. AZ128 TaxID=2774630 RepID=UPI003F684DFD
MNPSKSLLVVCYPKLILLEIFDGFFVAINITIQHFKDYFEAKEWRLLKLRLRSIKTYIAEKLEQLYTQFIKEPLQGLVGS